MSVQSPIINGKDIKMIDLTTGIDRNAFSLAVLDHQCQRVGWFIQRITFVVGVPSSPTLCFEISELASILQSTPLEYIL